MQKLEQIYEGKAKKVFKTDDPELLIVDYKDDATAFNGLKKGTILGKGVINNQMTNRLMAKMEKAGIPTHFVKELSQRETLVKRVAIVPLEVIVRNISAGSFAKRYGVKAELLEKQLPESAVNALADFIAAGEVTLDAVAARCADPAIADDLKYVLATANAMAAGRYQVAYCPSLVRGQGYYTGMVFEITCPQFSGAVAGGGRYDNMVGKFLGTQVPAVGFSIGFERVCGILLEQGYQIPGAKQKIALLYGKDADFTAVLSRAAALRDTYNVTVLPQGKKLGKQLGQLEAAGFAGAAFMDKDEVKVFAAQ